MANNCIIILNYNDCERVEKLVQLVKEYSSLKHILVVDNCSVDGSYHKLKKLTNDKIHVIRTEQNVGMLRVIISGQSMLRKNGTWILYILPIRMCFLKKMQ